MAAKHTFLFRQLSSSKNQLAFLPEEKKVLKTVSPFQAQKQSKRTDQNNTEIQLIDPHIPTFNHQDSHEPKKEKKKKKKTHSKKRRDKIESGEMCFKNDETQDFYLKDGTLVEPDL